MNRFQLIFATVIALFLVVACNGNQSYTSNDHVMSKESHEELSGDAHFNTTKSTKQENRKLIWTANLEFQVKKVSKSTEEITRLSEKYSGFVSEMNQHNNAQRISNTITVRVPNSNFQGFLSAIKREAVYMDHATIASSDVTEEYIDIELRLKTKREVRDRYITILNTKTGSVKDIIEAEEAIRVITEEIDAKEGRLRYLNNQIDLSTVSITLYEKVKYTDTPERFEKDFSDQAGDSFGMGWNAIKIIGLALIALWPILVPGIIILGIWKRKKIASVFRRN